MNKRNSYIYVAFPKAKIEKFHEEIRNVIESVLENGIYILGEEVKNFEKEFASFIGSKFSVGVANGTDAIALALKAVGVKPGDEIITVSHSAVATVAAIEMIGALPVFVDIDPITRCMNPDLISQLISNKTKAILPVHIYGQPARIIEIKEIAEKYELKLVEDCAQAHGAEVNGKKVGLFGDAAAFSFYPTKNLGGIGDGGAVITNSSTMAEYLLASRQYGWQDRYISSFAGSNSRLDELQAAILRVFLRNITKDNDRRIEIALIYDSVIDGNILKSPAKRPGIKNVYHLYVLESNYRDELSEFLNSRNIGTALHYPLPIHLQPAYKGRIKGGEKLMETERLYKNILSIPLYPELDNNQIKRITTALREWIKLKSKNI